VVDVVLIAAGAALTAFTGGAAAVVGKSLMGAGISGLLYDVEAAFDSDRDITKYNAGWGMNLAIGAIGGALGAGQAKVGAYAAKQVVGKAASRAANIAAQTAYGAATGALKGVASQAVDNYVEGKSASDGLFGAAKSGAMWGACKLLLNVEKADTSSENSLYSWCET
jgi:hypothetical protein